MITLVRRHLICSIFCCVPLTLAAVAAQAAQPQSAAEEQATLHILLVADTTDESVGKSCITDLTRVKQFFVEPTNIPKNRQVVLTFLTGDPPPPAAAGALKYSRDAILAYYKKLATNGEMKATDTIFFYYTGHGAYDPVKGHFLAQFGDLEHSLLRSELRTAIQQCRPRLTVIVTDCCANEVSLGVANPRGLTDNKAKVVENLFFKPTGIVDINSSSQFQESAGTADDGGFFTFVLFDKLRLEVGTLEKQLADRHLPLNRDGVITWRELFPLLLGPTSAKWKTAFPAPDCRDNDKLPGGMQCTQDPQAFCLPSSAFLDPPPAFKNGLKVEASQQNGKEVLTISAVDMGSAAEKGGLKPGDIISSIDNKSVLNACEFDCAINFAPDPNKVTVTVVRDSKPTDCVVKLDPVQ
jgi:hypothetical protein